MAEALDNDFSFSRPIPGEGMTAELGARPWQTPAQFTTVDDAIEYYMSRMTSEEFMEQVVDIMEMGVPVATLANTIQLSNVMEGKHSIDVGMLITPLLMELMMMLGDSAGIEYQTGLDDPDKEKTRPSFFAKYLKNYGARLEETDMDTLMSEEEDDVKEETSGLMSRRK